VIWFIWFIALLTADQRQGVHAVAQAVSVDVQEQVPVAGFDGAADYGLDARDAVLDSDNAGCRCSGFIQPRQ